jgi:DNA-directed RNA polymerase subunit K/omega
MERIPCDPSIRGTESCRNFITEGKCREDIHHLFFPRRDYTDALGRAFRELDENKVQTCRNEHNETHATTEPPERPSRYDMAAQIQESEAHQSSRVRRLARRAIQIEMGEAS